MKPKPYHGEVDAFTRSDKPAPAKKRCLGCGEPHSEDSDYCCEGCRARWLPIVMDIDRIEADLGWRPDMKIINHEREKVWLKECFTESGKRIGITDCCPAASPCDWHSRLQR